MERSYLEIADTCDRVTDSEALSVELARVCVAQEHVRVRVIETCESQDHKADVSVGKLFPWKPMVSRDPGYRS